MIAGSLQNLIARNCNQAYADFKVGVWQKGRLAMVQYAKNTTFKNHCFFWNTGLTEARMQQINSWIGKMNPTERKMLQDVIADAIKEEQWTASGEDSDS